MRYSVIMPYHKRAEQLTNTIKSLQKHYGFRYDWEIVLIEDRKNYNNPKEHEKLMSIIGHFSGGIAIKYAVATAKKTCWNPSPHFNQAAELAKGTYLVLTSPECEHKNNILYGFDVEFWLNPDKYIICGCEDKSLPTGWRQHSQHNRTRFHFCSAISKERYTNIGGFDEKYADGIAYDDNDFLCKVLSAEGITVVERDDLVVVHQPHEKEHFKLRDRKVLWLKNRNYFIEKWKEFGRDNTVMG